MRNLNRSFLKHDQTTDVLAFGRLKGAEALCADIAVSADTALRNCRVYGTTPQEELYLYIIHGVLHLLGYDDKTAGQRALMQKKAEEILKEP
jgi:probable rRNA maturation factor